MGVLSRSFYTSRDPKDHSSECFCPCRCPEKRSMWLNVQNSLWTIKHSFIGDALAPRRRQIKTRWTKGNQRRWIPITQPSTCVSDCRWHSPAFQTDRSREESTAATVFSSTFTPRDKDRSSQWCVHSLISDHRADKNKSKQSGAFWMGGLFGWSCYKVTAHKAKRPVCALDFLFF